MRKHFLYLFLLVSVIASAQPDTLRVLCVGNSFTYFYNSHEKLVAIAASEGHHLNVTAAYVGGYTFNRHLHDLKTLQAIEQAIYAGAYDVVYLQDQSQSFARYAQNPKQYQLICKDTKELVDRVRTYSPKARIWLEQTWAYSGLNYGDFGSYEAFDSYLCKGTKLLAKATHTSVSPIGKAFAVVRSERPDLNLYEPDEKHQSLMGTYLKSCVNYLLIYGIPFSAETDCCGVDSEAARYLQKVAERIVLK